MVTVEKKHKSSVALVEDHNVVVDNIRKTSVAHVTDHNILEKTNKLLIMLLIRLWKFQNWLLR